GGEPQREPRPASPSGESTIRLRSFPAPRDAPSPAKKSLASLGEATTRLVLEPGALAAAAAEAEPPALAAAYEKIARGEIRAHLQVIAGPRRGQGAELKHDSSVTVGRGGDSALDLGDPGVSVDQCVFEARGDEVHVRDAGSRNGTFVNGDKVAQRRLANGDIVACGESRILVTMEAGPGAEITE
ncbi:MAG TPA: FHA domain-containing protein, partial [Planctomycetota bacterium]|nr:FHA domain-containing protein [Planctomycetota bacterium]